jgi:hypothetical protein
MTRAILAFIAFNVYSLFLIAAFQENTLHLFDVKLVSEMRAAGEVFDLKEWGWKGHYIWRLFSSVIVTALTGFLAGAIARDKSGKVSAISNIPSVLIWAGTFYFMAFGEVDVEGKTGFLIVSLIAIPVTTWIAYYAGKIGYETQEANFVEGTVLGIRGWHWLWIVLPLYLYSLGIVFVVAKFFALQFLTWRDMSMVGAFISLLSLVPIIAWVLPLKFSHDILSGVSLEEKSPFVKALANTGILVGGMLAASAIQFICFWVLQKVMSWWY